MRVAIIGLGLIGGSIGLRLRKKMDGVKIIGIDSNSDNLSKAMDLGLITDQAELVEGVQMADVIIVAIPVDGIVEVLPKVLDHAPAEAVVLDMGSTKQKICEAVQDHPGRGAFVATHPIAGTENSGPEAAFDTLFEGKTGILCDTDLSEPEAKKMAEFIYSSLGMRIIEMDSKSHDMHIAYVSHLSHISSFVLGETVLEIEKDEKSIFDMAGSGFASTVRLAKSSPQMWASIFSQNREHISKSLGVYINNLLNFKLLIDNNNIDQMLASMERTNEIRRVLDGIEVSKERKEPAGV